MADDEIDRAIEKCVARIKTPRARKVKAERGARGAPRKAAERYWDLHLAVVAFRRAHSSLSKKESALRFLRAHRAEIMELGLRIGCGRGGSQDAAYRQLLNAALRGRKEIWARRFAHLRQSSEWQHYLRALKQPAGRRVIFISAQSLGE
jgi:hypothetical protein